MQRFEGQSKMRAAYWKQTCFFFFFKPNTTSKFELNYSVLPCFFYSTWRGTQQLRRRCFDMMLSSLQAGHTNPGTFIQSLTNPCCSLFKSTLTNLKICTYLPRVQLALVAGDLGGCLKNHAIKTSFLNHFNQLNTQNP